MTERLSMLLHESADEVVPPAPDVDRILRMGRSRRRRRPVGTGLAAAAAVAALTGGMFVLTDAADNRPQVSQTFAAPSAAAAFRSYGAFSVDSTVYVGNHKVEFDDKIKAMYYTGEGVLVRMGEVAETDSGEPSRYVLIHPDGTTRGIPLRMGDRVPGTDPSSPYVVYADPAEEGPLVERCYDNVMQDDGTLARECHDEHQPRSYHLVAVDLRTGEEAHRTTYRSKFTWGGWEAPPASTHGQRMWALFDDGWVEYDWATGKTRLLEGTKGMPLDAAGGHYLASYDRVFGETGETKPFTMTYVDFETRKEVGSVRDVVEWAALSPDGRVAMVRDSFISSMSDCNGVEPDANGEIDPSKCTEIPADEIPENQGVKTRLHTLGTGRVVTLDGYRWGWTPDGDVISPDPDTDRLTRCDSSTGVCTDLPLAIPDGRIKVGGLSYES